MSEHWKVGDKIENRYEIFKIKKGGMGIVFLCYDHEDKTPIAIKTFQDKFLMDNQSIERFIHEASNWIYLGKHKNIVRALYVQNINHRPYIFLEYIVGDEYFGSELTGWIKRKGLSLKTILNFAIQFCNGMIYAEEKFKEMGKFFVYRDIKPGNIMITKDRILKITDFGLIKTILYAKKDIDTGLYKTESYIEQFGVTKIGSICGTPPYMSPEQCLGSIEIDIRSDIYSFGCVLYEMFAGRPPFVCPNFNAYRYCHLKVSPEPLKNIIDGIPSEIDDIVKICLAKEKENRFSDFRALKRDLIKTYYSLFDEKIETNSLLDDITSDYTTEQELLLKGMSLDELGKHEEAIKCFNEILKHSESLRLKYWTYVSRGKAYENVGQFKDALEDYNSAISIYPSSLVYCNRGNIYNNLGELNKAIKDYDTAIDLDSMNALAYYNRGICYTRAGKLYDALNDFTKAIELGFTMAYTNRGALYHLLGLTNKALSDYNKALEINPRDVVAYTNRAIVYRGCSIMESFNSIDFSGGNFGRYQ
ncbi:MAG: serine/threonine-protein kinase [candidate division WOR-3 bacterium]